MIVRCLAVLALLSLLSGPAFGNPCVRCRKVVAVPAKVINRTIVKRQVAVVADIRFVPTFLATVLPAPSYNVNLTVPAIPAPAQAVQYQAGLAAQSYGAASYAQGYQAPAPQAYAAPAPVCDTSAILTELRAINLRLCRLEGTQPGPVAPVTPPPGPPGGDPFNPQRGARAPLDGVRVMQAKCAVCHEAKVAATDGKGLVLMDGANLARLEPKAMLAVVRKIYQGEMPPPNNKKNITPLTDEEAAALMELINAQNGRKDGAP